MLFIKIHYLVICYNGKLDNYIIFVYITYNMISLIMIVVNASRLYMYIVYNIYYIPISVHVNQLFIYYYAFLYTIFASCFCFVSLPMLYLSIYIIVLLNIVCVLPLILII